MPDTRDFFEERGYQVEDHGDCWRVTVEHRQFVMVLPKSMTVVDLVVFLMELQPKRRRLEVAVSMFAVARHLGLDAPPRQGNHHLTGPVDEIDGVKHGLCLGCGLRGVREGDSCAENPPRCWRCGLPCLTCQEELIRETGHSPTDSAPPPSDEKPPSE